MRIGIDATCWSNPRGYGRFTINMLSALLEQDKDNEYVFFMDSFTASLGNFPENATLRVIELTESPTQAASSEGRRSLKDMIKMGRAISREKLDIFFYPSVYTYFPIFNSAKKIVGIHDVIAEKYPEMIFNNWKNRLFWNMKTWLAVKQADLILTVSEFSKNGIAEHFGIKEDRIKVISEGSNSAFKPETDKQKVDAVLSNYELPASARYILYVGGIAPHKNLTCLIEAFSILVKQETYQDIKLILVGDYENDVFLIDKQLKNIMDNPVLKKNIVFTGNISDEDLNLLYNGAAVFVLPSFCEGFGLPALEAMSCGTVVIGSNTTSIPEVVGNAGLFFNPDKVNELVLQLQHVLDDDELRGKLQSRSLERAATFSWQRSANEMLQVINDLKIQ